MEETTKEPIVAQPKSAVDINFGALENAFGDKPLEVVQTKVEPTVTAPAEEKTIVEAPAITEPTPEAKLEAEKLVNEAKELGLPETATKAEIEAKKLESVETPLIEFKVEDILGDLKEPEDGTWLKVAKEDGLTITEDTYEAFIKAKVAPYEKQIEDLKVNNKIDYFASLKPETAANFQLLEMGIPEEQIFAPTKQIESYLSLTPSELVRLDYETRMKQGEAWTSELIDAKMEELAANPTKLQLADAELRISLTSQKEAIIQERTQLVQQYKEQKEQATLRQAQEEKVQFTTALNTVSKFMDVPLSPEVKQAIITKYNQGLYDNDFKSANAKVEHILYKELANRVVKELRNTAYEKGRDEKAKKLLAIPPVTNSNVGARVLPINQDTNNPFAAMEKAFGQ